MTHEDLRDLDIRRGKAWAEWYRAMRARYRIELTAQHVDVAEARLREIDALLKRAFERQRER